MDKDHHDPDYGEDLQQMALRARELALEHCDGCRDYHILWPYHRIAGNVGGVDSDRVELVPILRNLARKMPGAHWLIAGAADTGILATLVAAYRGADHVTENGYRVTVTDRCRTPLILCEEFGREHSLTLETHTGELSDLLFKKRFDGILLHSLFSFIPNTDRQNLLGVLRGCLKPGGYMVFCSRYGQGASFAAEAPARAESYIERFARIFETGTHLPPEDEEVFFQRIRKYATMIPTKMPGSFDSIQEMVDLLEAGGFTVNSIVHSGSRVRPGSLADVDRPGRVVITARSTP